MGLRTPFRIGAGEGPEDRFHGCIGEVRVYNLSLTAIDHARLTFKYQGRNFRPTDVSGEVVEKILV